MLIQQRAGIALYNHLFAWSIATRHCHCGLHGVFLLWGKGLIFKNAELFLRLILQRLPSPYRIFPFLCPLILSYSIASCPSFFPHSPHFGTFPLVSTLVLFLPYPAQSSSPLLVPHGPHVLIPTSLVLFLPYPVHSSSPLPSFLVPHVLVPYSNISRPLPFVSCPLLKSSPIISGPKCPCPLFQYLLSSSLHTLPMLLQSSPIISGPTCPCPLFQYLLSSSLHTLPMLL